MVRALWLLLLIALPAAAGRTCADCHAGAAERSWALSKHGVIARIEAGRERRRGHHQRGEDDANQEHVAILPRGVRFPHARRR